MQFAPQEIRTYFVTSATASRRRLFQVEQNASLLLEVLQEQRAKKRLQLHAFVIMPDHLHLILTPATDISLEKAMQFVKGNFSHRLKSKIDVWERSYTNHRIQDSTDLLSHIDYVHQNPVRKNLAAEAKSYKFSSANLIHQIDPTPLHFL